MEAADDGMECLQVSFVIDELSNRQRKFLEWNPVAFLVKKMRDSEVSIQKLSQADRELFIRAKTKEVDSFIKHEAVRRCLSSEEVKRAFDGRSIIRARWVLTWKSIPALADPKSTVDPSGTRKAKVRIVLLGFEHPSLLDSKF